MGTPLPETLVFSRNASDGLREGPPSSRDGRDKGVFLQENRGVATALPPPTVAPSSGCAMAPPLNNPLRCNGPTLEEGALLCVQQEGTLVGREEGVLLLVRDWHLSPVRGGRVLLSQAEADREEQANQMLRGREKDVLLETQRIKLCPNIGTRHFGKGSIGPPQRWECFRHATLNARGTFLSWTFKVTRRGGLPQAQVL